jgi:hypothetical protein
MIIEILAERQGLFRWVLKYYFSPGAPSWPDLFRPRLSSGGERKAVRIQ